MASRPILTPHPILVDESMASSITSEPTIITNLSMLSYDISWAGSTPVGVCTVEVSNTYSKNVDGSARDPGNWTPLPISGAVSGNTGVGYIEIGAISAHAIRLVYTRTSGTGLMNAKVNGKVS